jgi:flagella basal body P-ring formation protein FlgA
MVRNVLFMIVLLTTPAIETLAASLPGSFPLTSVFAEKLVIEELQKSSSEAGFNVLVDAPRLPMGNQERAATEIVVEGFRLDQTTGRFRGILVGTVGATPRFHLPLEGRVQPLVTVAVLSRTIQRGERIAIDDLDWIDLDPGGLPEASLTDPDHLIGTEARRRLRPGRVLTNRDVGPPRLVRRGQPVRVVYADGELKLTALGTARDDGAFGEPIRVINAESNLQLQGIATGLDEVTVGHSVMPGAGS